MKKSQQENMKAMEKPEVMTDLYLFINFLVDRVIESILIVLNSFCFYSELAGNIHRITLTRTHRNQKVIYTKARMLLKLLSSSGMSLIHSMNQCFLTREVFFTTSLGPAFDDGLQTILVRIYNCQTQDEIETYS